MNLQSQSPAAKNTYNLNQDQERAAEEFLQFLFDPMAKEFIISGAAGVGKTYLMNYIIDNTLPRYFEMCKLIGIIPEYNEVVMTATTNKAAEVLSQAVNRPTQTTHSFFNLTVYDDYLTGKTVIRQKNSWIVHSKKIIFIDESSMIDTELWKKLHEGTHDCKLVYVGDRHQLAPVHEDLSPIYKHTTPMVELLTPVRNANQPALMAVCDQLRQTVDGGQFQPIQVVPGVIDHLNGQQMQAEIFKAFEKQTHDARILAYTNKRVIEYNDHIRAIRKLPPSFTEGELLVSNNAFHDRNQVLPVEMELEVMKNHGPDRVLVQEQDDGDHVYVDVDRLDLVGSFGAIVRNAPFPTNWHHFTELSKYYNRTKNWKLKNFLKNNFLDVRPRDAATVHKSQGSTYDTVFIDVGNISTCHNPSQVARMLYVAFSRAKNRVFLYGDLSLKYGGLIG